MTKRLEPIPFAGMVEIDDEDFDKTLFSKTQKEVANELGITEISAMHDSAISTFFKEILPSVLTKPRITFPEKTMINTV